mgnify:FL=1
MKFRMKMDHYTAYDLTIRSDFRLPELPFTEDQTSNTDVEIRRGNVDPVPESASDDSGRYIDATPSAVRMTYESLGSFLIKAGERIICDPIEESVLKKEVFHRLIENELLGLILHQRNHLVVHASAVSVNGQAVVFLGPRGAGKSTTAAAFHTNGYPILEDDVVAIRFDSDVPTVLPGVPQLRLRPDAATALGLKDKTAPSSDSWYEKRFLQTDELTDPVPLARCYILREGEEFGLEAMNGPDPLLELVSRTYARGLLGDTNHYSVHFQQCRRVIETAPVRILRRPDDHTRLPTLIEIVVRDLK